MKPAEKDRATAPGTAAKANPTANRIDNRPSLTREEATANENDKNQATAQTSQTEVGKAAEGQAGSSLTVGNQPADATVHHTVQGLNEAPDAGQEKAEPAKAEEVKEVPPKIVLNLEQTLKSVNDLHRLSIQRLALIARIKTLEDFEVKLAEESDELESNPYQACKLIIEDDKRRQFVTNTPNLIRMVSQFIFNACEEKLAEIEANIIFPNA